MIDGLVESAAAAPGHRERRIFGIAIGQVVDNVDSTNRARVQIRLPWLPGFDPWARVATLMAGSGSGSYFMPQVGDEVVVAFNHGDVREPYILGSVWNGQDRPPSRAGGDARDRRILRTPAGHEVVFDDGAGSITITSSNAHRITLGASSIVVEAAGSAATLTLESGGKASLEATTSIELRAPKVSVNGKVVELTGSSVAKVEGQTTCVIKGGTVAIN